MATTTKYDRVCTLIQQAKDELVAQGAKTTEPAELEREETVLTHLERAQAAGLKMQRRERANGRSPVPT